MAEETKVFSEDVDIVRQWRALTLRGSYEGEDLKKARRNLLFVCTVVILVPVLGLSIEEARLFGLSLKTANTIWLHCFLLGLIIYWAVSTVLLWRADWNLFCERKLLVDADYKAWKDDIKNIEATHSEKQKEIQKPKYRTRKSQIEAVENQWARTATAQRNGEILSRLHMVASVLLTLAAAAILFAEISKAAQLP